jgi:hypothetical protein
MVRSRCDRVADDVNVSSVDLDITNGKAAVEFFISSAPDRYTVELHLINGFPTLAHMLHARH